MLASLTAFAITSAARLLTGARALWLGCTAQPTQRLYFANHSSHGDFVLLWASLPPELRRRTRPVAVPSRVTDCPVWNRRRKKERKTNKERVMGNFRQREMETKNNVESKKY